MVSLHTGMTVAILSVLGLVQAVPLADKLRRISPSARDLLKRSTPAAPHFLAYNDKWINPLPSASELQDFNVFALSFLLPSGAVDQAEHFQQLTVSQRATYVQEYNAAGISLIVSAFGSSEWPTSSGIDAVTAANTMAAWVIQYGVNGIDVDYEDLSAFDSGDGSAESWLVSFTQQLRMHLPGGQYILTHSPLAPWFSPSKWGGGGYLAVDWKVGSLIDWYNIQFYNQGKSEYTTCSSLLIASSSAWPETALFQIAENGVSLDKLVIGKPGSPSDASNGYIDPSMLASCVSEAASRGWDAGVAVWQYPDANSPWMTTVRGNTWPAHGSPSATTATTTIISRVPLTSIGSGNCASVSEWSSSIAYPSGSKVTHNGVRWTADQWNRNDRPGEGPSSAWTNDGACT